MQETTSDQELRDRLSLIETMITEGRRTTKRWGWTFVLWGAAYMIAMAWATWGHGKLAWPVTIIAAVIVTGLGVSVKGSQPETTMGRAIISIWIALGVTMFVLFPALGVSGQLTDQHLFASILSAILGMANGASGLILRWKIQLGCALVWWTAAVVSCFGTDTQRTVAFLIAIFLCQIVFGAYAMTAESRERKRRGATYA